MRKVSLLVWSTCNKRKKVVSMKFPESETFSNIANRIDYKSNTEIH